MSAKFRRSIERKIVSAAIRELIDAGFRIDVDDDESGYFIADSTDHAAVMKQMFQLDDDRVFAENNDLGIEGWLFFVYGNDDGLDVLNDYTVNLEPYLSKTFALVKSLEEQFG